MGCNRINTKINPTGSAEQVRSADLAGLSLGYSTNNRTIKIPMEIASLIWEITKANVSWGRVRIANQLALLNIFLSASTVRNILNQPKPQTEP